MLDGTLVSDDEILEVFVPVAEIDQLAKKPWVDNLELASQDTSSVDVGSVWLEALVETEDLGSRSCRHRSEEKRVAKTVLSDVGLRGCPVPSV